MAPVAYVSHPASLEHDTGAHPERAARIVAIEAEQDRRGWAGLERHAAPRAERALLETLHPASYLDEVERMCAQGRSADPDTVASPGTWEAALRAAGGAALLADLLMEGAHPAGFSAMRPPGHHAERARAMGFCFLGNAALAARRAIDAHGAERVLLVDWDVHHGNGSQDLLYEDDRVLFCSIHQWPLYPGTGHPSERGRGPGEGYTVNLPVPSGSGDETFCSLVEHVIAPLGRAYRPDLVLISAGFDSHRDDPLAGCDVTEDGFVAMTRSLQRVAAEADAPVGALLEGGYDLGALAASVAAVLDALGSAPGEQGSDVELHPLAAAAAEMFRPESVAAPAA
jgi:acetoin utilization deacetylase AcuC-like enzyme